MGNTARFSRLLGECRRQMNGAVASSMRYYGAEYGLNYGVSLPTVRSLAIAEGKDHDFARYLYLQQVREIRLASLHIAQCERIASEDLEFWAEGIINSEVAEEAAFALFQYVDSALMLGWLKSKNHLLVYTALLAIAKNKSVPLQDLLPYISDVLPRESLLLSSAIITLLESYYREKDNRPVIDQFLQSLEPTKHCINILNEMQWRCELLK